VDARQQTSAHSKLIYLSANQLGKPSSWLTIKITNHLASELSGQITIWLANYQPRIIKPADYQATI
jgi:hypothetical protein